MIGSANQAWIPCTYMGNTAENMPAWAVHMTEWDAGDYNTGWQLPLPTNRGGKKLYVSGIRILLKDADATNYIDNIYLYGVTATGQTIKQTDTTNYTTTGEKNFTFTAEDMSSFQMVHVGVDIHSTNPGDLDFLVLARCYYDD